MERSASVTAVAFSPNNSVIAGDGRGGLHHSRDGGETWRRGYQAKDSGSITSIATALGVSHDKTLFIGTEKGGVFKSVDEGVSFAAMNMGLTDQSIRSLALSPEYTQDFTIFASTWHEAVFQSKDGGNSWQLFKQGVTWDEQADSEQYKSPYFRELRISKTFAQDKTIFLAGFDGLFKSTDGGQTWIQMETLPVKIICGLGITAELQNKHLVAITTYGGGIYTTLDQGGTWSAHNKGLIRTRLTDVVFASDGTLFSAELDFLLKSRNQGNSWSRVRLDEKSWTSRIRSWLYRLGFPEWMLSKVIRKTEKKGSVYPTVIAVSPDFTSDHTVYFGTRMHGIFKSKDGGLHNSAIWDGMGQVIPALGISPAFSSDATLFATVRGKGIYKTTDGGLKWHAVNNGLAPEFVNLKLAENVRPTPDLTMQDIKLSVSSHYKADETVFAGSAGGLYKTEDGGASWHRIEVLRWGEPAFIIAIASSPDYEKDRTVFVSVKGRGLFKSTDGGRTFVETGLNLIGQNYCLRWIVFSPSYAADRIIYGASDEELFQSDDGGETWKIMPRPARYEDSREVIHYEGDWRVLKGEDFSAATLTHSNVAHSRATLTFVGTGVSWLGSTGKDQGMARVFIDGSHVSDVDQFSDTRKAMMTTYSIAGLPSGPHTITIEVADMKNPKSTGFLIEIDAFNVSP
jgi:photosystem II stability/assembly factor-like uncharacterized protein